MDRNSIFVLPEDAPGTFDKDDTLPSLPLPKLEETLERYYESLKPFGTPEELKNSRKVIDDFKNGIGKKLHALVEEKAKKSKNWVEEWWENLAYLSLRLPLIPCCLMSTTVIGESVGIPETPEHFLKTCALLAYQTMTFWHLIRSERMRPPSNPDGSIIFSANLFKRLYNTVRLPGEEMDEIKSYFKTAKEGKVPSHIIVIGNGRFFVLKGTHEDGSILSIAELYRSFQIINSEILENKTHKYPYIPLLTQDERPNWHKNRSRLMELSKNNKNNLELIESAICLTVLDDRMPRNYSECTQQTMAGGISTWADKSATLVMFRNGKIGCLAEHACFDGSVSAMTNFFIMLGLLEQGPIDWDIVPDKIEVPKELKFDLDEAILKEIDRMEEVYEENLNVVSVIVHCFQGYGKELMKAAKIHPDTFVQSALQLVYYRLHGKMAPTYETATMRAFYRGRTETVRSCNMDMVELCNAWFDSKTPAKTKVDLFRKASKAQYNLMLDARKGKGIDRHLFGLWCAAYENKIPIPELYDDPLYAKSGGGGNFVLSTSTLGYTINIGCVAPMVVDGYGVFYSMLRDCCWLMITTYKSSNETSSEKFQTAFDEVMMEVKEVFEASGVLSKM
ncbi:peroxisomal carnitine O-octanoyltransferase [Culicoides brevitarsis]|uniref:peroxisomal carnitine O-octanoyltransferase n=1 Tax=Culicoides brevitarsis TaxID=469753 RepID=UPI00307B9D6C